jgi:hypothetical protein
MIKLPFTYIKRKQVVTLTQNPLLYISTGV